jgi:hypothetical protein
MPHFNGDRGFAASPSDTGKSKAGADNRPDGGAGRAARSTDRSSDARDQHDPGGGNQAPSSAGNSTPASSSASRTRGMVAAIDRPRSKVASRPATDHAAERQRRAARAEIARGNDFFALDDSVGFDGKNIDSDVIKVGVVMTEEDKRSNGRSGLTPSASFEPLLGHTVQRYQKAKGLQVDGMVTSGGPTINALQKDLGSRFNGFRAPKTSELNAHKRALAAELPSVPLTRGIPRLRKPTKKTPVTNERASEIPREVDALLTTTDNTGMGRLYAGALIAGGLKAVAVLGGFLEKLAEVDKKRADEFEKAVSDLLPDDVRKEVFDEPPAFAAPIGKGAAAKSGAAEASSAHRQPTDHPDGKTAATAEEKSKAKSTPSDGAAGSKPPAESRGEKTDIETSGSEASVKNDPLTPEETEELKRLKARYQTLVYAGHLAGYKVAARNLQRFLDGIGGTKVIDSGWLRDFEAIRDVELANKKQMSKKLNDSTGPWADKLSQLREGESMRIDVTVNGELKDGTEMSSDLHFASNASYLDSTAQLTATRRGNEVVFDGTINTNWHDTYDWHPGLKAGFVDLPGVPDAAAARLEELGGAKSFEMVSNWDSEFRTTAPVVKGRVVVPEPEKNDGGSAGSSGAE